MILNLDFILDKNWLIISYGLHSRFWLRTTAPES